MFRGDDINHKILIIFNLNQPSRKLKISEAFGCSECLEFTFKMKN